MHKSWHSFGLGALAVVGLIATGLVAAPDAQAAASHKNATSQKAQKAAPKATAAEKPAANKQVPTRIVADGMTYAADNQQVEFKTNVHVSRPDFELWSDVLTVHLKPAKKKAKPAEPVQTADNAASTDPTAAPAPNPVPDGLAAGDIDRIVARGNVRMKREGRSGTGDKATYTVDTALFELEGTPRLTDGENTITGERILYFMNENRSEVIGGPKKRVEAIFSTSSKPTREGAN